MFSLHPVSGRSEEKKKAREEGKERQMEEERPPVTERKTMGLDVEHRAGIGITMGDTQNGSRFPLIFSRL